MKTVWLFDSEFNLVYSSCWTIYACNFQFGGPFKTMFVTFGNSAIFFVCVPVGEVKSFSINHYRHNLYRTLATPTFENYPDTHTHTILRNVLLYWCYFYFSSSLLKWIDSYCSIFLFRLAYIQRMHTVFLLPLVCTVYSVLLLKCSITSFAKHSQSIIIYRTYTHVQNEIKLVNQRERKRKR